MRVDDARHAEARRTIEEREQELCRRSKTLSRLRNRNWESANWIYVRAELEEGALCGGSRDLRPSAMYSGGETRRQSGYDQLAGQSNRSPQERKSVAEYSARERGVVAREPLGA